MFWHDRMAKYNISHYTKINATEIDVNTIEDAPTTFSPELTQLKFNTAKGIKRLYIYRWCYTDRESLYIRGVAALRVNKNTISEFRIGAVRNIINDILNGKICLDEGYTIEDAFNYIDQNSLGEALKDNGQAKQIYITYTNELIHKKNLANIGNKKNITAGTAKKKQKGMRLLISYLTDISSKTIQSYAINITNPRLSRNIPEPRLNDLDVEVSYKLHERYFSAFTNYILDGHKKNRAVVVRLEDLGFSDYIGFSYRMSNYNDWLIESDDQIWRRYAFTVEGFIEDWDVIAASALLDGVDFKSNLSLIKRKHKSSVPVYNGVITERDYRYFINAATKHFVFLLLLTTGANTEQLSSIDFSESKLERDAGANRIIVVKPRAQYEKQTLIVDSKFNPIWRQYLKLRESIVRDYDPEFGSVGIPMTKQQGLGLFHLKTSLLKKDSMNHWPKEAPALTTRAGRKYKTNSLLEESKGDVGLVSHMMQRSEEVTRLHYSFKKFEDSAIELTRFFDSLYKSSIARINSHTVVAPIIDSGKKIQTGYCTAVNTDDIRLSNGFNNLAPEPRCGAPLTCFFCESFGIHATEEDIVRLLSVKEWIKYQSNKISRNIDEHAIKYLPIIQRIDEIIESFKISSEESQNIIYGAIKRIKSGRLDPYWQNRIDALIDALEV